MSNHRTLLQDMKRGINCRLEVIAAIESLEAHIEALESLLQAEQDSNHRLSAKELELAARNEALTAAPELSRVLSALEAYGYHIPDNWLRPSPDSSSPYWAECWSKALLQEPTP